MSPPTPQLPAKIHQIWIGGPPPQHLAEYMRSWQEQHPTWTYKLWGDDDLDWLQHRKLFDRAHRIVPPDAVSQFKADLARYEILLAHGGFYADADTECLAPIDHVMAGRDAFAAAEDANYVGNTYLGCTPGHPVMQALVDGIPASVAKRRGQRANRISGPRYVTPIWNQHGCHVDPVDLWFPYSYSDIKNGTVPDDYGAAYAAHHWHHTRTVLERRKR